MFLFSATFNIFESMSGNSFEKDLIRLNEMMKYLALEHSEVIAAVNITMILILCYCTYMLGLDQKPSSQISSGTRFTTRPESAIIQNAPVKTGWEISPNLLKSNIGVNFNQWRKPDSKWGPEELDTLPIDLSEFDLASDAWERATTAVDLVLEMLLQEIKKEARLYSGLLIDKFVRQGSSREGLKVSEADEFDALLLFKIEGVDFKVKHLKDNENWTLPEFGNLVANGFTQSSFEQNYQKLYRDGVFSFNDGMNRVILNSRNLQEKVFKSIIMKASNSVEKRVNTPKSRAGFDFSIRKFRINPPSINIEINLVEKEGSYDYITHLHDCLFVPESRRKPAVETTCIIDVDIVPGLEIAMDTVPDPTDWNGTMKCPRYAVFKWFTDNQPAAARYDSPPDILWRVCSSGYEKHVLDVSRGSKEECYIVTALRIMKREFRTQKKMTIPPLQILTVLRSYHLKQIAFYCILYLVVINKEKQITIINNMKLSGVKEALAYFLDFLEVCLEERRLPHFFHANDLLVYMFPDYKVGVRSLRYDLFTGTSEDALWQAELSFRTLKCEIKNQYCRNIYTFGEFSRAFREFVKAGKYYTREDTKFDETKGF